MLPLFFTSRGSFLCSTNPSPAVATIFPQFTSYTVTVPEATDTRVSPGRWCQPVEPPGARSTFAIAMSAELFLLCTSMPLPSAVNVPSVPFVSGVTV